MVKKYKSAIPYLIIVVLIALICVSRCSRENDHIGNVEQLDSTSIYKAKLEALHDIAEIRRNKIKIDSIATASALQALKSENKDLRKRIVPVRKEVEKIADTVAIVKQFLGLTDSLDVVQEATIDTLSAEKVRIWRSFNTLLANKDDQIKLTSDLGDYFQNENHRLANLVKKERRRKTIWKVASGILAVGILYQAIEK